VAFALDELIVPEGRGCGEDPTGEKALAINDADAEGGSATSSCRKLKVFGQCPFQKYVKMNDRPLLTSFVIMNDRPLFLDSSRARGLLDFGMNQP